MEVKHISKQKQYGQIPPGECFELFETAYMKGTSISHPSEHLCIRLSDGLITEYQPDTIVTPLKGKVTFEV